MKIRMYAYRDAKNEGQFSMPMTDFSDDLAKRHFAMVCSNSGSEMGFAPQDFDLYYLGEYDFTTGQVDSVTPEFVCNGVNVV